jgi:hypothetical protein
VQLHWVVCLIASAHGCQHHGNCHPSAITCSHGAIEIARVGPALERQENLFLRDECASFRSAQVLQPRPQKARAAVMLDAQEPLSALSR